MEITAGNNSTRITIRETTEILVSRSFCSIMKAQNAGNMIFDGHIPTAEEKKISEDSRSLCTKIERHLRLCQDNEIPALLNCYNLLSLVGYRHMPDSNLHYCYKRRIIEAWKKGDSSIEESDVMSLMAIDAGYHPEKSDNEFVKIYLSIKSQWVETLLKFNTFPGVTSKEKYERLALIMRDDIDRYIGSDRNKLKQKWYKYNINNDLTTISTVILRSYHRFISALYPAALSYNTQIKLQNKVLRELSTRTNLNFYDREAYRFALEFNTRLLKNHG